MNGCETTNGLSLYNNTNPNQRSNNSVKKEMNDRTATITTNYKLQTTN
jgi:hypothetical protein